MKKLKYKNSKSIELLVAALILLLVLSLYNLIFENSFKSLFSIVISGTLLGMVLTKHEWAKDAVRYWGIFNFVVASYNLIIMFVAVYSEIPYDNVLAHAIFSGIDFVIGILLFTENDKMFIMESVDDQINKDSDIRS